MLHSNLRYPELRLLTYKISEIMSEMDKWEHPRPLGKLGGALRRRQSPKRRGVGWWFERLSMDAWLFSFFCSQLIIFFSGEVVVPNF
jgi:hypothetical protein